MLTVSFLAIQLRSMVAIRSVPRKIGYTSQNDPRSTCVGIVNSAKALLTKEDIQQEGSSDS